MLRLFSGHKPKAIFLFDSTITSFLCEFTASFTHFACFRAIVHSVSRQHRVVSGVRCTHVCTRLGIAWHFLSALFILSRATNYVRENITDHFIIYVRLSFRHSVVDVAGAHGAIKEKRDAAIKRMRNLKVLSWVQSVGVARRIGDAKICSLRASILCLIFFIIIAEAAPFLSARVRACVCVLECPSGDISSRNTYLDCARIENIEYLIHVKWWQLLERQNGRGAVLSRLNRSATYSHR